MTIVRMMRINPSEIERLTIICPHCGAELTVHYSGGLAGYCGSCKKQFDKPTNDVLIAFKRLLQEIHDATAQFVFPIEQPEHHEISKPFNSNNTKE